MTWMTDEEYEKENKYVWILEEQDDKYQDFVDGANMMLMWVSEHVYHKDLKRNEYLPDLLSACDKFSNYERVPRKPEFFIQKDIDIDILSTTAYPLPPVRKYNLIGSLLVDAAIYNSDPVLIQVFGPGSRQYLSYLFMDSFVSYEDDLMDLMNLSNMPPGDLFIFENKSYGRRKASLVSPITHVLNAGVLEKTIRVFGPVVKQFIDDNEE